ncbi:MAG: phage tail protein [Pseudomonadales bacterium]|nr:phage tail protein [Pseudomonadales bacterium]
MKMRPNPVLMLCLCLSVTLSISMSAEAAKENFVRSKPHLSVAVSTPDIDLAGFRAISGLGVDVEVAVYESGSGGGARKLPGRTTWSDITLKRGFTGSSDVESWVNEGFLGDLQRRDISLVMHDSAMRIVRTYHLVGAFPVKWRIVTDQDGYLLEEVSLTFDRVEISR